VNSQELIAALNQKLHMHSEVLKSDSTGMVKCSNCDKLIRNHEYTKGLIYAYRDVISLVAYHDEP
jgi:ribosomal protein L32